MPKNRKLERDYTSSVRRIAGKYERQAAWIGISATQIETGIPDLIYVRLVNGQGLKAVNKLAPLIYNYPVVIARADTSAHWEVVEIRQPYGGSNLEQLKDHHTQHEYPARDTVWVRIEQFTHLLVLPLSGFVVNIYGGVILQGDTHYTIENQTLDLSAYVPTAGAVWALVEAIGSTITVTLSSEVTGREFLTPDLIPNSTGTALCAIQLYAGQGLIKRDGSVNDFVDLRFTTASNNKGGEAQGISFLLMGA